MQILPILQASTMCFHSSITRVIVFIKFLISTVRLDVLSSHFLLWAIRFLPFELNSQYIQIVSFKLFPLISVLPPFLLRLLFCHFLIILHFPDNQFQLQQFICLFLPRSRFFTAITRHCLHCSYFKSSVAPFTFRHINYKYNFLSSFEICPGWFYWRFYLKIKYSLTKHRGPGIA